MNKLFVILGPTSTGKTDMALNLAKKFNGELVSCDSRQVYKGLDIGTGKMPARYVKVKKDERSWEMDGIKVWMYDVVSPKIQYTVADYVKDASGVIRDIQESGKLPIIVGGTGLYLKALLDGLPNLSVPIDQKLRKGLEHLNLNQLQKKLKEISSKRWGIMNNSDQQNPRRLIRAIELELGKENREVERRLGTQGLTKEFNILKIGLTAKREILYRRSDERVLNRIKLGMIEEAERLKSDGLSFKRMKQLGLEYGVLADFLDGKIKTQEEFAKNLQIKIHGYIKRQSTWFKKEKAVIWFDINKKSLVDEVEKLVGKWYHHPDATQN